GVAENKLFVYNMVMPYSLAFYAQQIYPHGYDANEILQKVGSGDTIYVFTNQQGNENLKGVQLKRIEEREYEAYNISAVNINFLNPATRDKIIHKDYLLKVCRVQ